MKPIIALDADGVLLDYHSAYREAWARAFGTLPQLRDPNAYWPIDRWDVRRLEGKELNHFRQFFDDDFWSTIPSNKGAVDACIRLNEAGFELICVSAIEERFCEARLKNLRSLGFPIDRIIATSSEGASKSPKAEILHELQPIAFVDDYLPYHVGVSSKIHRALVLREPNGSPNVGKNLDLVDSTHTNLALFADWWLLHWKGT